MMQHQALLENYLRQLRLPTFAQNYQAFAKDAARSDLTCERYLLAHLLDQGAKFSFFKFLSATNRFFNPGVNGQLLFIGELQYLEPLVLGRLLVSGYRM